VRRSNAFDSLVGIAQAVQVIERVGRVLNQVMLNGNDPFDVRLDLSHHAQRMEDEWFAAGCRIHLSLVGFHR
jgi:hypothetical protein